MKLRLPVALAAGSLLASAGLLAASMPTAHAALVTRCVGDGGSVTVPGDLVVPAGKTCWLDGTQVKGDVTVSKGADLVIFDGTIKGSVTVKDNGYLDTTGTDISGKVTASNAYGTYFETSALGGAVNATGADSGFVYLVDSSLAKQLNSKAPGEVVVDGSRVGGAVVGDGTNYTDVTNSTVEGGLGVTDNASGATVCNSEVYGDASFLDNAYALQVGADGPISSCDGVSYFGANLDVSGNTGDVRVANTIVRGDLSGDGNDPAPTGDNNRVRGTTSGQFADLQPTAPATLSARAAAKQDRDSSAAADTRRAAAKQRAAAAGSADL